MNFGWEHYNRDPRYRPPGNSPPMNPSPHREYFPPISGNQYNNYRNVYNNNRYQDEREPGWVRERSPPPYSRERERERDNRHRDNRERNSSYRGNNIPPQAHYDRDGGGGQHNPYDYHFDNKSYIKVSEADDDDYLDDFSDFKDKDDLSNRNYFQKVNENQKGGWTGWRSIEPGFCVSSSRDQENNESLSSQDGDFGDGNSTAAADLSENIIDQSQDMEISSGDTDMQQQLSSQIIDNPRTTNMTASSDQFKSIEEYVKTSEGLNADYDDDENAKNNKENNSINTDSIGKEQFNVENKIITIDENKEPKVYDDNNAFEQSFNNKNNKNNNNNNNLVSGIQPNIIPEKQLQQESSKTLFSSTVNKVPSSPSSAQLKEHTVENNSIGAQLEHVEDELDYYQNLLSKIQKQREEKMKLNSNNQKTMIDNDENLKIVQQNVTKPQMEKSARNRISTNKDSETFKENTHPAYPPNEITSSNNNTENIKTCHIKKENPGTSESSQTSNDEPQLWEGIYAQNKEFLRKRVNSRFSEGSDNLLLGPVKLYNNIDDYPFFQQNTDRHSQLKAFYISNCSIEDKSKETSLQQEWKAFFQAWKQNVENSVSSKGKLKQDDDSGSTVGFAARWPVRHNRGKRRVDVIRSDAEMQDILNQFAEAERIAKTWAKIPPMILGEKRREYSCIIDNNSFVLDPVTFYEINVDFNANWTIQEKEIFYEQFKLYPKKFGKIAAAIENKSSKNCVLYYYQNKKALNLKELIPKNGRGQRMLTANSENPFQNQQGLAMAGQPDVGIDEAARVLTMMSLENGENPFQNQQGLAMAGQPDVGIDEAARKSRLKQNEIMDGSGGNKDGVDDGSGKKTTTGDGRTTTGLKEKKISSYWNKKEINQFEQSLNLYGRDFKRISEFIKTKSEVQVKNEETSIVNQRATNIQNNFLSPTSERIMTTKLPNILNLSSSHTSLHATQGHHNDSESQKPMKISSTPPATKKKMKLNSNNQKTMIDNDENLKIVQQNVTKPQMEKSARNRISTNKDSETFKENTHPAYPPNEITSSNNNTENIKTCHIKKENPGTSESSQTSNDEPQLWEGIYAQNKEFLRKRVNSRFSEGSDNLLLGPVKLYNNIDDYPFFQQNTDRHSQLKAFYISNCSIEDKSKETSLQQEWKAFFQAWKQNVENSVSSKGKLKQDDDSGSTVGFAARWPVRHNRGKRRVDVIRSDAEMQDILNQFAEAERIAKTWAKIPPMILGEKRREYSCIIDNNSFVLDPVTFYEINVDFNANWTIQEKEIFYEQFKLYPKKFGKIAAAIENKSSKNCVLYYYQNKKALNLKELIPKNGRGQRMLTANSENPFQNQQGLAMAGQPDVGIDEAARKSRLKQNEIMDGSGGNKDGVDDGSGKKTTTGDGRTTTGLKEKKISSYWNKKEINQFEQSLNLYGRDFKRISEFIKTKSEVQVKNEETSIVNQRATNIQNNFLSPTSERIMTTKLPNILNLSSSHTSLHATQGHHNDSESQKPMKISSTPPATKISSSNEGNKQNILSPISSLTAKLPQYMTSNQTISSHHHTSTPQPQSIPPIQHIHQQKDVDAQMDAQRRQQQQQTFFPLITGIMPSTSNQQQSQTIFQQAHPQHVWEDGMSSTNDDSIRYEIIG
ncbi:579_t:CDS:10 [Entrophospora sp. SA101]|nr:579_t:CDS:10 [Entrophospora sp. SA101]